MNEDVVVLIAALTILLSTFAPVVLFSRRYKKVPPDKAMVVYGKQQVGKRGYQVISGGGKFIWPIIESYEFLPLDVRTLDVNVDNTVTDVAHKGPKVNIKTVAQVKISSDRTILYTAAEHLLHKSDAEINEIATKTLEGHVRGVCATLTIELINSERESVSGRIQAIATADLNNVGIEIRSFVITEIEEPIPEDAHYEIKAIVGNGVRVERK
jgi:flotillin